MFDDDVALNETDELVSRAWGHAALALLVCSDDEAARIKWFIREEVIENPAIADDPDRIATIIDRMLKLVRKVKAEDQPAEELKF